MGTATVASEGDGAKTGFPFTANFIPVAAQFVTVPPSREEFTADFADFADEEDPTPLPNHSAHPIPSVPSAKSAVQSLGCRLSVLCPSRLFLSRHSRATA